MDVTPSKYPGAVNTFDGGSEQTTLPEGLYELLQTESLETRLSLVPDLSPKVDAVDQDDAPEVLSRHVAEVVKKALTAAKPEERVALANRLMSHLDHDDQITPGPQQLLSLHRPDALKRRHQTAHH